MFALTRQRSAKRYIPPAYFEPLLGHPEFRSTHLKLNQYQSMIGAIIAIQLQSSIRNTVETQPLSANNNGQGML
jgi:hypothetical protein